VRPEKRRMRKEGSKGAKRRMQKRKERKERRREGKRMRNFVPWKFSKVGANGLEDRQARARGPALPKDEPATGANFLGISQSKSGVTGTHRKLSLCVLAYMH